MRRAYYINESTARKAKCKCFENAAHGRSSEVIASGEESQCAQRAASWRSHSSICSASTRKLSVAQAREHLGSDLAHTTVMTALVRLHGKGLVDRERRGRSYVYTINAPGDEPTAIHLLHTQ